MDPPVGTCPLKVVVDPSKQYRFRRHFEQIRVLFIRIQQLNQFRTVFNGNLIEEPDSNDLPEESQNEMGFSFRQVMSINVDH